MDLPRLGSVLSTRWGAAIDVGSVHSRDEDSWLASPPFFAVVDGMGGHAGGALASSTAVRVLGDRLSTDTLGGWRVGLVDLSEGIHQAVQAAAVPADPEDPIAVPGSTLTGVFVLDTEWGPFWLSSSIGDPRTYIVGGDSICQVTRDHSAVQEACDLAELAGEKFIFSPSNVVTRALGAGMAVVPDADYASVPLFQGDYALMYFDGVRGAFDDKMIVQIVCSGGEPRQIANESVDTAITSGTRDNATIVVIHVLRVSRAGDACEVHSRQIQAVCPVSTTAVRRGVN